MTNNYKYNSTVLSDLISDTSNGVSTSFNNISTGITVTDMTSLKDLEKPMNVNYKINGTDIANSCRAKNYVYSTNQTDTLVTTTGFTHFSAYIVGGCGGGGGSGGDATRNNLAKTNINCNSTGGTGGSAGYVALTVNIALGSENLYITVGDGGNGGNKGDDDNQKGQDGSDGNNGNAGGASYIKLGTTIICQANGGGGGNKGNGATSGGGSGNDGTAGNSGTGQLLSNYTNSGVTTYNSTNHPYVNLSGGGDGGNPNTGTIGVGRVGSDGYVRIYLKKQS
jgi:hypothetical protein